VAGAVVGWLVSVPVVVASRRNLAHFGAGAPHYRAVEWLANRLTSVVIANSTAVREKVLRQERLSADRVAVIHNGIDTHAFGPLPEEQTRAVRRALALDGRWPVVGIIANLIDYKGLQYFLPAWASVVDRHRKAVVLLVGDGPLRGSLETRVRALGLDDAARFLGNRADVPALLALMDLVVHPSLEEGFSNAILEAMAAGKPVVATAVGGTPEAVTDGVTGRLVPARDAGALAAAMLELLGSSDEPRRLGEAARRRVYEHFRVELMVRRHEQLYADALARHRGGAGSRVRTRAHRADP
jgi:glycosyltransferase involved in cell wall biosynthesis